MYNFANCTKQGFRQPIFCYNILDIGLGFGDMIFNAMCSGYSKIWAYRQLSLDPLKCAFYAMAAITESVYHKMAITLHITHTDTALHTAVMNRKTYLMSSSST